MTHWHQLSVIEQDCLRAAKAGADNGRDVNHWQGLESLGLVTIWKNETQMKFALTSAGRQCLGKN